MTDPVDRAATDQLTAAPPGQGDAALPGNLAGRVRTEGTRKARAAAGKVIDKVAARAAHAVDPEIDALHREIASLRDALATLRADTDAELAAIRAELLATTGDEGEPSRRD